MNWYLEQKHAWDWKSMLPGGGQKPQPMQPKAPSAPAKPQRSREMVERDKKNIMMQMNHLRGPGRGAPDSQQKLQQLQQTYQQLLHESSLLHEMTYDFAPKK